jgi:hypothetical protein
MTPGLRVARHPYGVALQRFRVKELRELNRFNASIGTDVLGLLQDVFEMIRSEIVRTVPEFVAACD